MTGTHAGHPELEHAGQMEEMIQAIVDQFDRTFTSLEHQEALALVKRFLEGLDEATLRALAYRQGIFEPETGPAKPGDEEC